MQKTDANLQAGLPARLDSLSFTLLHLAIVLVCAGGLGFDLAEVVMGTVLGTIFSSSAQHLESWQLPLLLSAMYVGAVVGAPVLGRFSKVAGPRHTFSVLLALLAVTSMCEAVSPSLGMLTGLRMLSGVALGCIPPVMFAYLADILPPSRRGTIILLTTATGSLGITGWVFFVRLLSTWHLFGFEAWREAFFIAGIAVGAFSMISVLLPESPRWLLAVGGSTKALAELMRFERSRQLLSFKKFDCVVADSMVNSPSDSMSSRDWILLGVLYFLSAWPTTGFPLLTGALLTHKGFDIKESLLYVALSATGYLVGAMIASAFIDFFERRNSLLVTSAGMVCGLAYLMLAQSPTNLTLAIFVFNVFSFIFLSALTLYGAELFDAASRAGQSAKLWSLNRIGAAIAPFALLPALSKTGAGTFCMVIGATVIAGMLLLILLPLGKSKRPLGV